MYLLARRLAWTFGLGALASAACAPAATFEASSVESSPSVTVTQSADIGVSPSAGMATAYPPPLQTTQSAEATAMATRQVAIETAAAVGRDEPIAANDMQHYSNPVLGLAFAYPRELGEVTFEVRPGETGEAWWLRFTRFDALRLAGVSPDFSFGRDGIDDDTYGYARNEDGSFRWLLIPAHPDGIEIEAEAVLRSASGVEIVTFRVPPLMGSPDEAPPSPLGALVNLAGDRFPGLIVLNSDSARLPEETLRAILRTFEVGEPASADAAADLPPGS